jgi:hypothetical protein
MAVHHQTVLLRIKVMVLLCSLLSDWAILISLITLDVLFKGFFAEASPIQFLFVMPAWPG